MLSKISSYALFISLIAACGGTPNPRGAVQSGQLPNPLQAIWSTGCTFDGSTYSNLILHFLNESQFVATTTAYSDWECYNPILEIKQQGTYASAFHEASDIINVPQDSALFDVSFNQTSLVATPFTYDGVTSVKQFCSSPMFSVNEETSLAGISCSHGSELANGASFSNLIAINGNTLYLGAKAAFIGVPPNAKFSALELTPLVRRSN